MTYKTIKNRFILFAFLTLAISGTTKANSYIEKDTSITESLNVRPVQLTFFAPLGSNGIDAYKISNNFSLNMLTGVNGGLDGAEVSGLVGINLGDVKGAQFAGWANINTKSTRGGQFAGLANYSQGELIGAQFAGLSNICISKTEGLQAAGLSNMVNGELDGVQMAGLANLITKSSKASQFAGLVNGVTGYTEGIQVAGIGNFSMGNDVGQISGIFNSNIGNIKGLQIAGIANINTNRVKGFQGAGIYNFARYLNGVQLGLFNYTDSLENGVVIGLLSFVKNGYRSWEMSTSESFYGVVGFRTGTDKFYNIISLGAAGRDARLFWGFGYGLGTTIPVHEKTKLQLEALSYHINEDEAFTKGVSNYSKIQIKTIIPMGDYMKLSVGPTWNIYTSEQKSFADGSQRTGQFAPYSIFDKTYKNDINLKMYPGFIIGIHF